VPEQQQIDSVLLYLTHHGQHIDSIDLDGLHNSAFLEQLPHRKLQGLSSLICNRMRLLVQPWVGFQHESGGMAPLKKLQLDHCTLHGRQEGLAEALSLLPELQHLSFVGNSFDGPGFAPFPCSALPLLQEVTYLELACCVVLDPDGLHHLQVLTRLQDLRLVRLCVDTIQASMLSGLHHLTRLHVGEGIGSTSVFEPDALAGKTQLQHLEVVRYCIAGGSAGVAQLLSHLHPLQHLTYLDLKKSLRRHDPSPPATAYSALTASSKLRHLGISFCTLPAGVWQHILPAGRQLPKLQGLDIGWVDLASGGQLPAPEGTRLVSCCPGLQMLRMEDLQYTTELLAPLTGLSSLQELALEPAIGWSGGLEVVCQLTGLTRLDICDPKENARLMLQLTQLQQLAHLDWGRLGWNLPHTFRQVSYEVCCASPSVVGMLWLGMGPFSLWAL
jgi:hypothetical protein